MNPFNHRSIAAHRDACEEQEAQRDMEAHEWRRGEDRIRELAQSMAPALADLYEAGEAVYTMGGDDAVELALAFMETERTARRYLRATPDHDKEQ